MHFPVCLKVPNLCFRKLKKYYIKVRICIVTDNSVRLLFEIVLFLIMSLRLNMQISIVLIF